MRMNEYEKEDIKKNKLLEIGRNEKEEMNMNKKN